MTGGLIEGAFGALDTAPSAVGWGLRLRFRVKKALDAFKQLSNSVCFGDDRLSPHRGSQG